VGVDRSERDVVVALVADDGQRVVIEVGENDTSLLTDRDWLVFLVQYLDDVQLLEHAEVGLAAFPDRDIFGFRWPATS